MSPNLEEHVLGTPRPKKKLTAKDDEFGTPDYIFDPLNDEFRFDIDAAATFANTKCRLFVDKKMDALTCDPAVFDGARVWCNPPYSKPPGSQEGYVSKFVRRFFHLTLDPTAKDGPRVVVLLVPTKTEQPWYHDFYGYFERRDIPGRIKFIGGESTARDSHMLIIFRSHRWIWNGNQSWMVR